MKQEKERRLCASLKLTSAGRALRFSRVLTAFARFFAGFGRMKCIRMLWHYFALGTQFRRLNCRKARYLRTFGGRLGGKKEVLWRIGRHGFLCTSVRKL